MMLFNRMCRITGILLAFCFVVACFAQVPKAGPRTGKLDFIKSWTLPNAPSGTRPDQAWHSVGSAPDGDIYISGHDHATNSMLYRLYQKDDTLRYVGDARAASQAVNNWNTGETCQKFHTRPIWHNGKVYVASTDRSNPDGAYLQTRGFHWYAYDIAANTFSDICKDLPGGVGAAHLQMITINVDPASNMLYGTANASCEYVSYDITNKVAKTLGRPSQWTQQYAYCNRFFWVDSRHRVYLTAGNERAQWYQGEPKAVYDNVFYYDPSSSTFGEVAGYALQGANAIEVGQWTRDRTKCYMSDDQGHIYCFTDNGATWTYLGRPGFDANIKVWTIEVSPNGDKLYVGRCDNGNGFWEFDIAAKTSRSLCSIADCDDQAASKAFVTGYDTWDQAGNFYVADFSMNDGNNVILTRINPVRMKVAKGLLPALVEVTAAAGTGGTVVVTRTGATTTALKVIYDVVGLGSAGEEVKKLYGSVTIPAGSASINVTVDKTPFNGVAGIENLTFIVAFDGDNYLAGAQRTVSLGSVGIGTVLQGSLAAPSNSMQAIRNSAGTLVRVTVVQPSLTQLNLYDLNGKLVKKLLNRHLASGSYDISLNQRTGSGNAGPGIFIVKMTTGKESVYQKVHCF